MSNTLYTTDHEYIRISGDVATVGITDYAQKQLGDIVYVDLPDEGAQLEKGAPAAVVESVKAASEVYAPVSGVVTEVNSSVRDNPELVNKDAAGEGWFLKMRISDAAQAAELMDEAAYLEFVRTSS